MLAPRFSVAESVTVFVVDPVCLLISIELLLESEFKSEVVKTRVHHVFLELSPLGPAWEKAQSVSLEEEFHHSIMFFAESGTSCIITPWAVLLMESDHGLEMTSFCSVHHCLWVSPAEPVRKLVKVCLDPIVPLWTEYPGIKLCLEGFFLCDNSTPRGLAGAGHAEQIRGREKAADMTKEPIVGLCMAGAALLEEDFHAHALCTRKSSGFGIQYEPWPVFVSQARGMPSLKIEVCLHPLCISR